MAGLSDHPTVSVLLPVKDAPREYLRQAIDSIVAQTFADWELVIVEAIGADGESATRALPGIADTPGIRVVEIPPPTNLVAQLNKGLEGCRGALVARMDADDICRPNRLQQQVAFLENHPEMDVVGSQIEAIDGAGRRIGARRYPLSHEAIVAAMQRYNPLAHPAVMFRKDVVLEAGGYRYPERAAQDYELWCRLARAGRRFANLPEPLLQYRLHAGAVKVSRLRDTIRSTLATKQAYWSDCMSWRARGRMWLERAALSAPPAAVNWIFRRMHYR